MHTLNAHHKATAERHVSKIVALKTEVKHAKAQLDAQQAELANLQELRNKFRWAISSANEIAALKAELVQAKAEADAQQKELTELRELRDTSGWVIPPESQPSSGAVTVAPQLLT
jgi:predicted RNase H-like nuclease (RuvC/YqgF family)